MNILSILLIAAAFILTRVSHMKTAVQLLVAQALTVAAVCAVVAAESGSFHGYLVAVLTLVVKAGLIPYSLLRMLKASRQEKEVDPILSRNLSSLAAGVCLVLAYNTVGQLGAAAGASLDALAAAVALVLLGLMLIMTRRQAVMQIVGLLTMENGLYLVGLSITHGLPLIIELGIFFDVLIVAVVLSILIRRLKLKGLSTDTSRLQELKG